MSPRQTFGFMGSRAYVNMAVAVLVLVALEVPVLHLIVGTTLDPGAFRVALQAGLALSSAGLVVWLWRDHKALRQSQGVSLDGSSLQVDMGKRAQGTFQLSELEHAALSERLRPGSKPGGIVATPLQAPNVFLRFSAPQRFTAAMGPRMQSRSVALFVDEPEALVRALRCSLPGGIDGDGAPLR